MKTTVMNIADRIFVTLFYLYACLGSCNITFGSKIVGCFMWLSFILGGLLVLYKLIRHREYMKMPGRIAAFALVGSVLLSTLANYQYNLKDNVVLCIYWVLYFIVLYAVEYGKPIEKVRKDFEYLGWLVLITVNISVIIGFWQMYKGIAIYGAHPNDGFAYWQGFAIGRLWGLYLNPNRGGITVALTMAILLYFLVKSKKLWFKLLYIIDMVLMLLYLALSDSRSGAVSMGVMFGAYVFFAMMYSVFKKKEKIARGIIVAVAVSILIVAAGYVIPRKVKDGYNILLNAAIERDIENIDREGKTEEEIQQEIQDKLNIQKLSVDRGYDMSQDVSNGRFIIWESGLEIYTDSVKNMIIGTTFHGFTPYAVEKVPETAIVAWFSWHYTTLESDLLHVLVSQGIVGFIILVWFVIAILMAIVKNLTKIRGEHKNLVFAMLALLFGYAASAFLGSAMLYQFSNNTVVFWAMLGYVMYIVMYSGECYED